MPDGPFSDPPQLVEAPFDPQVTITPGQLHALVITEATGGYSVQKNSGNFCPDGQLFFDCAANDTFTAGGGGNDDLVYTVTLV